MSQRREGRDYDDGDDYKPEYQPIDPEQRWYVPTRRSTRGWRDEVFRYILLPLSFGVAAIVLAILASVCG